MVRTPYLFNQPRFNRSSLLIKGFSPASVCTLRLCVFARAHLSITAQCVRRQKLLDRGDLQLMRRQSEGEQRRPEQALITAEAQLKGPLRPVEALPPLGLQ